jgi:Family of unknown function (DUF5792)
MITYDPNSSEGDLSTPISQVVDAPEDKPKGPPTGLLKSTPEKNVDQSQMAEFATPIEEIMPGPSGMIQDEMMGPAMPTSGNKRTPRSDDGGAKKKSKNPFGLADEQYMAVLAGVAAVVAFSKPVQSRLQTAVPKFMTETGEVSLTGLAVSALVAAIVFYFAKQFLADKA